MLITNGELPGNEHYTYCPDCGKLMKVEESNDVNSIVHCDMCSRNYRQKF